MTPDDRKVIEELQEDIERTLEMHPWYEKYHAALARVLEEAGSEMVSVECRRTPPICNPTPAPFYVSKNESSQHSAMGMPHQIRMALEKLPIGTHFLLSVKAIQPSRG